MSQDADAIVVGAGLAGLVATAELAAAGRRVILVDQGAGGVPGRPGPLIAVRLHILTRKSLGGLQTNLNGQVLRAGR